MDPRADYDDRAPRPLTPPDGPGGDPASGASSGWPPRRWAALAGLLLVLAGVYFLGRWHAADEARRRQFTAEYNLVGPLLGDPAYAGVQLDRDPAGGVRLGGTVQVPADRGRLLAAVARALGEPRAAEVVQVGVADGADPPRDR